MILLILIVAALIWYSKMKQDNFPEDTQKVMWYILYAIIIALTWPVSIPLILLFFVLNKRINNDRK